METIQIVYIVVVIILLLLARYFKRRKEWKVKREGNIFKKGITYDMTKYANRLKFVGTDDIETFLQTRLPMNKSTPGKYFEDLDFHGAGCLEKNNFLI